LQNADPFTLQRFVDAQNSIYHQVLAELRRGQKESHWMWFVFPQIQGLGYSNMSRKYAISSREEAEAYLSHPILGQRLRECTDLVNQIEGSSIGEIFGYPDDLKFHSSVTLFSEVARDDSTLREALRKYFGGQTDQATMKVLRLSRTTRSSEPA
jgi:uncharacterized protein (DUF1810 family)